MNSRTVQDLVRAGSLRSETVRQALGQGRHLTVRNDGAGRQPVTERQSEGVGNAQKCLPAKQDFALSP